MDVNSWRFLGNPESSRTMRNSCLFLVMMNSNRYSKNTTTDSESDFMLSVLSSFIKSVINVKKQNEINLDRIMAEVMHIQNISMNMIVRDY